MEKRFLPDKSFMMSCVLINVLFAFFEEDETERTLAQS